MEMIHNTSCIQITVRGGMQIVAAHLLRLIIETLRVLLSGWYSFFSSFLLFSFHFPSFLLSSYFFLSSVDLYFVGRYKIGYTEFVPCPHCVTRGVARPTLFGIDSLETSAAKGIWYAECGSAKISLEKFVPDVALLDFWGY